MSAPQRNLELKALDPDPPRRLQAALDLLRPRRPAPAEEPKVSRICEALNITGDLMVARGYADLLERRG